MSASGWIEVDEAARRSGRWSEGHVRRLCRDVWAKEGKAREISGGGKRRRWQVREDAAPELSRVKFPDRIGTDLRQVSESKRKEALARKRILDDWWEARGGGIKLGFLEAQITEQFLTHLEAQTGRRVSRATLFNWEKRWRTGGLAALVDGRGNPQPPTHNPQLDPFLEEVRRLYLSVRRLKLTACREIALLKAAEKGWTPRSYTTCQRAIDAVPKAVVLKLRFGEEAFVNQAEPFLERDYSTLASNETWCGDHHQFDVIVNAGGKLCRPWITAWLDMRSRKIVGYRIFAHDPNGDTILAAFDGGVRDCGVPRNVYIDNGKDFDSFALNGRTKADRWLKRSGKIELDTEHAGGVFAALDVKANFAWAYHGQSKPVERFFGTIEQATVVFPTYCGNTTAAKPEDLQLNLERGKAPTLAEFCDWFAGWLAGYHATVHLGDGMGGKSPDAVFAENLSVKRTAPAELLDLLLLKPTKPIKVTQNGVTHNGLRYGQHELLRQLGQEVILRVDNRDLSRVLVFTTDGKFLCVAHANRRLPANATSQELRDAIAAKRRARQIVREYTDARPRMHEDLEELIVRAKANAAQGASGKPDPKLPPPVIKPVRSTLEDQLPAVRKALEVGQMRKAVGAEHFDLLAAADALDSGLSTQGSALPGPKFDLLKALDGDDAE